MAMNALDTITIIHFYSTVFLFLRVVFRLLLIFRPVSCLNYTRIFACFLAKLGPENKEFPTFSDPQLFFCQIEE